MLGLWFLDFGLWSFAASRILLRGEFHKLDVEGTKTEGLKPKTNAKPRI
jgi:hypothetical protein